MAQRAREAIEYEDEGSGSALFGRFLLWVGLAALAVGSVVWAAQTETGSDRLAHMFDRGGARTAVAPPAAIAAPAPARPTEAELEQRRLAETVRTLAADRDRLLARLDTLERNLEVTGSVAPAQTTAPPRDDSPPVGLAPPLLSNWSLAPGAIPPAAGMPSAAIAMPPVIPAPPQTSGRAPPALAATEQGAESTATRTEFAVDIGGDSSLDGLRALWASLKASHAGLFDGLRPVVAIREGSRPGALDLRLVVGPLANAGAAARLCASLAAAGQTCQPTIFDGQRLALR
jgi:hypothetical protein